MDNEEFLTAFDEYLQTQPLPIGIASRPQALAIVRELSAAIDPVPLEEATLKEIKLFERDHKAPTVAMRPLPVSSAEVKKRLEAAKAAMRAAQIRLVMTYLREFRKKIRAG